MKGYKMKPRRRPTSVMVHERNRLAADLFRACAEGHIKDIKRLKPKFNKSCKECDIRLLEDEQIRREKEAKKLARLNKQKTKPSKRKGNKDGK